MSGVVARGVQDALLPLRVAGHRFNFYILKIFGVVRVPLAQGTAAGYQ